MVLRQNNSIGVARGLKDDLVGCVTQEKVTNSHGMNVESRAKPVRQDRRQLRVYPDRHAATIG